MYTSSVSSPPSRRRRRPLSVRPSVRPGVRPVVRPVVIVRPLSVRPQPSRRLRQSSVRLSWRPSNHYLHNVPPLWDQSSKHTNEEAIIVEVCGRLLTIDIQQAAHGFHFPLRRELCRRAFAMAECRGYG